MNRDNVVVVGILGQLLGDFMTVLLVGFFDGCIQSRLRAEADGAVFQIGKERGVNVGSVGIGYSHANGQSCAEKRRRRRRKKRQMWTEQEEADTTTMVELQYLAHNGEGRIIHNDVGRLIIFFLIVATRVERPHKVGAAHVILARHEIGHGFIHHVGRVTVVGGLLCLELLHELLILWVVFAQFAGIHSFLELTPLPFYCLILSFASNRHHLLRHVLRVDSPLSHVEPFHICLHSLQLGFIPRQVHLRGKIINKGKLTPLRAVNVHVSAFHGHQFIARRLNHTHPLDAGLDGRLLCLVAGNDVVVPVYQDRTSSTQLRERALHQLPPLIRPFVEVVRILHQLLNVNHFFFHNL